MNPADKGLSRPQAPVLSDEAVQSLVNQYANGRRFDFSGASGASNRTQSGFGWFEVSDVNDRGGQKWAAPIIPAPNDFKHVANELCERALNDAKAQLHPLLRSAELDRLNERADFLQAFKSALEKRIAQKLAVWQPGVQAVFKFDETRTKNKENWDGSIHLLVKVPRLSNAITRWGKNMDRSLTKCLNELGWSRFRRRQTILEVQQVTPRELRHGVSYGAMFSAVYNVPVKVWPPKRQT